MAKPRKNDPYHALGRYYGCYVMKAALVMMLLFTLPGCALTELNERILVSMAGVDKLEDGTIRLTLGLIVPKKQGGETITVYSSEGATIYDASRRFIQTVGNQLMWPYIKVIVIGSSIADDDVVPILDFFNRNNEIQPNPYVTVSRKSAEDIVRLRTDLPELTTLVVETQIINQELLGFSPRVKLYQFNEMMYAPAGVGYASLMKIVTHNDNKVAKTEGMAVLKGGKLIGELGIKETRGVLWMKNEINRGILVVHVDEEDHDQSTKISLEILECVRADVKPAFQDDQLIMKIEIKARLSIGEILGYLSMDETTMDVIKEQAQSEIRKEIKAALKIVQKEWRADIVGFGVAVHRKYPQYWKENEDNWEEIFQNMTVEIQIDTSIHKVGLIESYSGR